MQISKRRRGLIAAATAVIAALAVAPQTGWLVRQQARGVLGAPNAPLFELAVNNRSPDSSEMSHLEAAAARFPNDVGVQMALAESGGRDWRVRAGALQKLEARFPQEPALLAAELRAQTMFLRVGYRPETSVLMYDTRTPEQIRAQEKALTLTPEAQAQHAKDLARFEATTRAGAKLAPDNVYFALMRAAYLFELRRDDEAVGEIMRAGALPKYDAYVSESIAGRLRFARAAEGQDPGAISDVALIVSQLYMDMATQRGVVHSAVWCAMERERARNVEDGIAIRLAVARLGETMRTQATPTVGVFGGAATVVQASLRSGAAPAFRDPDDTVASQKSVARFVAYLNQSGHASDAYWYQNSADAAARTLAVCDQAGPMFPMKADMSRLLTWYTAGLVLLWSALIFVSLGFSAHLLTAFSPWVRKGAILPPVVQWGIRAGSVAPLAHLAVSHLGANGEEGSWCIAAATSIATFALLRRARFQARPFAQGLAIAAMTTIGVWGLMTYLPLTNRAFPILHAVEQVAGFWSFGAVRGGLDGPFTASVAAALALLATAYPLTLFALSKRAGAPPVLGMLNGLRGLAVPLACMSLLAYGAVTVVTARRDAALRADLAQIVENEAQFLAERTGKPWPSPVPFGRGLK